MRRRSPSGATTTPPRTSRSGRSRTEGRVVGVATLFLSLDDNTDKIWAELDVHPDHRRRGAGSALAELLERRAREVGRPEILVEVYLPPGAEGTHPYARFAAAHGYEASSTDAVRILDLPVEQDVLDRLEARGRERWADAYRLETHTDGLPDALVPGYCRVSNLLNVDAPTGDVDFEAETLTPERYRGYLDLERSQGRVRLTTVAVEVATGEVVAYTDLVLPSGAPTKTWQWGTLVDREHRGHRLGMAVKVANLRELQRGAPGARDRRDRQRRDELLHGGHQRGARVPGRRVRAHVPQGAHRPLTEPSAAAVTVGPCSSPSPSPPPSPPTTPVR